MNPSTLQFCKFKKHAMQRNAVKIPGATESQHNLSQFHLTPWSLKCFGILPILKLLQDSSTKALRFPSSKTSKASGHWEHRELTVVAMLTASGEICINGISSTIVHERRGMRPRFILQVEIWLSESVFFDFLLTNLYLVSSLFHQLIETCSQVGS